MHVKAAFQIDGSTTPHMRNFKVMASALASVEKVPISRLGHPTGSREMAVVDDARAFRLTHRVQAEDDPHGFAPVGAFVRSVQQPQIRRQMLFVVGS